MRQETLGKNLGLSSEQWRTTRGDKWAAQLAGMEATFAVVDEPLLDALELGEVPLCVADIGCGGGGTSRELWRRTPESRVVGFDISETLIELARAEAERVGAAPQYRLLDAGREHPGEAFDCLLSRFGVMFFEDEQLAFANLARWLRPGGRFAFAVWAGVEQNVWMSLARTAAAESVPLPLPVSGAPQPFRYAEPSAFCECLERAGFTDLLVRTWTGAIPVGGDFAAARAAEFALSAFSNFAEVLGPRDQAPFRGACERLTQLYAPLEVGGVVRAPATVHIVTGARH